MKLGTEFEQIWFIAQKLCQKSAINRYLSIVSMAFVQFCLPTIRLVGIKHLKTFSYQNIIFCQNGVFLSLKYQKKLMKISFLFLYIVAINFVQIPSCD